MLDELINEMRPTTSAEEQNKIDGTEIHSHQKETRKPLDINAKFEHKVGFTGKKKEDYELIKSKK